MNYASKYGIVAYVNTATRRWRKVAAVKFGILRRSKEVRGVSGRGYLKPPIQVFHSTFRSTSLEVKKKKQLMNENALW